MLDVNAAKQAFDWVAGFCCEFNTQSVSILWHGGEPLMVGSAFIEEVATYYERLFENNGIACHSRLQTNLLLFDDSVGRVVRSHFDGVVGFSYDWNVPSRVFPNGKDAAHDIWDRAISLQEKGFKLGAITQLAPSNVENVAGLYRHFADAGISFKLSQVFPAETGDFHGDFAMDPELAARAACHLFDIWLEDRPQRIHIEPFRDMISSFLSGETEECSRRSDCSSLLMTLLPDGGIYPCSRYTSSSHIIGNWRTDSPQKVLARRFDDEQGVLKPIRCASCCWAPLCGGGCAFNRRTGWHEQECLWNRRLFSHIAKRLHNFGLERNAFLQKDPSL